MTMRKAGKLVGLELFRTGIAVMAVAAVILVYQGCSQPADTAEDAAAPGVASAQEEAPAAPESAAPAEAAEPEAAGGEAAAQAEDAEDEAARAERRERRGERKAKQAAKEGGGDPHAGHAMPPMPGKAIAVITPTEGNECTGTVTFTATDAGVTVEANLAGLTPGKHGFHIHEFGDISAPDGTSLGGHFNPAGVDHAGPDAEIRHVGDLGNVEANEEGNATYSHTFPGTEIHFLLGRGVVVHADEDDLATQPTGNAGGRVGVGVIGVAKSE